MAATPLLEELAGGTSSQIISQLSGFDQPHDAAKQIEETLGNRGVPRKLSVYSASAGFELLEELEYLTYRTVEPNIFFNPRFLAPAMPRLDDRQVRFMVMRDENDVKSRLLWQGVQPGFNLAPIVICPPIAREFLNCGELHALRRIRYRFLLGPLCRGDASAEIDELLVRNVDAEGADFVTRGRLRRIHRKKARGTRCDNSHRGGPQELAPVLIDNFGTQSRTHRNRADR
jgi:hypothetical protein